MRHTEFPSQTCSIARSLEIFGEWWTLLIIREAFFGTERFSEFEMRLGISKNVLSERLAKLVDEGILDRTPVPGRGNPVVYRLTESGRDLLPIIVALMQWGDRWTNRKGAPVRLLQQKTGREVRRLTVASADGKPLAAGEIVVVPGPGADTSIKERFGTRRE